MLSRYSPSGHSSGCGWPCHESSLVLNTNSQSSPSYTENGSMIPAENNAMRLFTRLFVNDTPAEQERQAELGQRVQVGQVLDLGRPLSQAVNIRANGALIGTGELMEIGGRIAVGITSLGPAQNQAQGSPE